MGNPARYARRRTSSHRSGAVPSVDFLRTMHHQNQIVGIPIGQEVHAGREQQCQQSAARPAKKISNAHEQRSKCRKEKCCPQTIHFALPSTEPRRCVHGKAGGIGRQGECEPSAEHLRLRVNTQVEIPGDLSEWHVWARFIRVEKRTPDTAG